MMRIAKIVGLFAAVLATAWVAYAFSALNQPSASCRAYGGVAGERAWNQTTPTCTWTEAGNKDLPPVFMDGHSMKPAIHAFRWCTERKGRYTLTGNSITCYLPKV
jgi:hypothetical protein